MVSRRVALLFAGTMVAVPVSAQIAGPLDGVQQGFVANHGQWPGSVEYRCRAGAATSWFVRDGWLLQLASPEAGGVALRMTLERAAAQWPVDGETMLSGPHHFLIGERKRWKVDVPAYECLRYRSVYPGVDIEVRPSSGLFEYDVHLAAGAELSRVVFDCDGMDRLEVDTDGSLVMHTAVGDVRQAPPVTWQTLPDGGRRSVECAYRVIDGHRFGFVAPDRLTSLPTVIDPDLRWSTYLGGGSHDAILDMKRGAGGAVIVAGYTESPGFPVTAGAFQTTHAGGKDVFVSAFDPSQTGPAQLRWSTFVGGAADRDVALGLAVDPTGEVIVVGYTYSADFPTTVGPALSGRRDAFVTRLSAGGAGLVYSRLLGGAFHEWACDVVIDSSSVTTVVGSTGSDGFPTTPNAYQSRRRGGLDCFVTRLDAAGNVLYSSFLGGSFHEGAPGSFGGMANTGDSIFVALDAQERLVLTGSTSSRDFPVTPGAYQVLPGGSGFASAPADVFALRLDPNALPSSAQLQWSTYLGGGFDDVAMGLDVQPSGLVTIGGCTYDSSFPTTPGAYSRTFVGSGSFPAVHSDAILVRLDPARSGSAQLVYSTFLSSTGSDCVADVAVDRRGYATVVGTCGARVPTTLGAFQTAFGGGIDQDAFVAKLSLAGQGAADLVYGSHLGGTGHDQASVLVPDGNGGALIAGMTDSPDFPVANPYQGTATGGSDGFVAHLDLLPDNVARLPGAGPHCEGSIVLEVDRMPVVSNPFAFLIGNAPPNALGGMLLGSATSPCLSLPGAEVCLLPVVAVPVSSDPAGTSSVQVITPPGLNGGLAVQTVWINTVVCAGVNPFSSSTGLGL